MNKEAMLAGYMNKSANPLWNSNKNEWAGGGVNPLNWVGRVAQPAMDKKVNTRIGQVNAGTAPAKYTGSAAKPKTTAPAKPKPSVDSMAKGINQNQALKKDLLK
jgi:hypothetical protein